MLTEAELYQRGIATMIASWGAYARCASDASVQRHPGVTTAVFRCEPERAFYNNAVLDRRLNAVERAQAVEHMHAAYAAASVGRFAAWVHEADTAMQRDLVRLGYTLDETVRAMGLSLDDIRLPQPELDLRPLEWPDYLRIFDLPPALLANGSRECLQVVVAFLDDEPVTSALTFDLGRDCGIYNVGTLDYARRRGLATALTTHVLHQARTRGCTSASLQSTQMAERVYTAVGFQDFGRLLGYVPARGAE
ncbi:MAG TPA: GNAT family N-acetyltransferase [Chloroflexota bacterium]|jgi:ribosomal protein S18 acetylase RimI-like enzyme